MLLEIRQKPTSHVLKCINKQLSSFNWGSKNAKTVSEHKQQEEHINWAVGVNIL